ncbi:tandem-95 repeat protein [Leptothermofonsia sichuanensis E412]|uniref:Ig-like domain-containing protein n=1 Tax=Leptothermofonsia sichuanensis TaxID=2917832 RepID=UPI001CA749D7|nr:Ig-like domain-containing protein [Leptothermofonsia sichuanensis]QZZ21474.1 tandem-95 repeat protein [Leptothermofonsia sichuanensis E412]
MSAGNSLSTATLINLNTTVQTFPDTVTATENDYYRFTLSNRSSFNLSLTGLSADADVALLDSAGNPLTINGIQQRSANSGTFSESINTVLEAGTYFIHVFPGASTTSADYSLNTVISNNLFTDILWRNYASGQNAVWFLNGTTFEGATFIQPVTDLNYGIAATVDFNGDGETDILWRNNLAGVTGFWLMNGLSLSSVAIISPSLGQDWQVYAAGDFNQDGQIDLLWRNNVSGEAGFWLLNGTTLSSAVALGPTLSLDWQIQGVADFNGDGRLDIFWRNFVNGQNGVWFMNGTSLLSVGVPLAVGSPDWRVSGFGDFNRDGKPDILWRNYASGENAIWLMNGLSISSVAVLPSLATDWRSTVPFIRTGEPTPIDLAGNSLPDAFNIGSNLTGSATYRDAVGGSDPNDYYRFSLGTGSNVNLSLTGLNANLDLQLLDINGDLILTSNQDATTSESIIATLPAGTYYARVYPAGSNSGTYALNVSVNNLPVLATNNPLSVTEGEASNLTGTILRVTDNDNTAAQLTYTLGTLPQRGVLLFNGTTLVSGATFTQADIDNGTRLRYQHDGSETLTDSFTFTVTDGVGGNLGSNTFNIAITPANDPPVFTVPSATQAADQDANLAITGISIADPDAGDGLISVTLSAANGVLTLGFTTGLAFSQGTGVQNSSMIFSGTLAAVNNALSSLIYRSNSTFRGVDVINLSVTDNGNTGEGGPLSDTATIAVAVSPINQAPIISLPPTPTGNEDTNVFISGISITDIDGFGGNVTVSLSAVNGVLTLNSTSGLTLLNGSGTQDRTMVFRGPLALVNAALNNLVYLGNQDFNGTDFITISVNDSLSPGTGGIPLSDTKTLAITVNPVNDAPVLTVPATQTANENTNLRITGVRVSDVDAGNGSLIVSLTAGNGTLSLGTTTGLSFSTGNGNQNTSMVFSGTLAAINNALATLTYRGNSNFNGTDTVNISVNDNGNTGAGIALSDSAAIAINVLGINSAPVITVPLAPSTNAGVNLAITGVSVNDPDAGAGTLLVTIAAQNGVLSIPTENLTFFQGDGTLDSRITFEGTLAAINTALGALVYRSNPGFTGFETITISVNDQGNTGIGTPLSDTRTLFVNVGGAVNIPPTANPDTYTINRNGILNVSGTGVLGNDIDPDSPSLNAILVNLPAQGFLSLSPTGSFTYTPNPGFSGIDTFTYRASDGIATSNLATVTINVTVPANNPPIASPDIFSLNEDTTRTGNVLANDTDAEDGIPQTAQLISGPSNAANFTLNSDGSFTYTPIANYNGIDLFTYIARDSAGAASNTATVTLSIIPVNDLPVAANDTYTLSAGTTLSNVNVLDNDTDIEDIRPGTAQLVSGPGGALSFVLNSDGSFTYVPNPGVTTDSFTYIARDSEGGASNPATVFLTITAAPNTPPVAVNDIIPAFDEDTSTSGNVLDNDTDLEDTRPQTAQLVSGPSNAATFVLNPNGTFTYTPIANFNGTDSFTYIARDSAGAASNTATVFLSIIPVNDLPVAVNDTYTLSAGTTLSNVNVLDNDTDIEDIRPGTAQLVSGPGGALSFILNSDGSFTYVPNPGVTADSFTYIARDSEGGASNPATVFLTITAAPNTPPVAVNDIIPAFDEDTSTSGNVLDNDTDLEDTRPQTAQLVSGPSNAATFVLNPNGTFTYTPIANFNGTDSFTYIARDSAGAASNTATVFLSIIPVNDLPVAVNDTYTLSAGTTLSNVNVLDNDTDIEDIRPGTAQLVSGPGGALSFILNSDGSFTYVPNPGVTTDSFTYIARDSEGGASNPATVFLTITAPNTPPVAVDDIIPAFDEDTSTSGNVLDNDTDLEDTRPQTAQLVSGPSNAATFVLNPNGTFTYTPIANFNGTDSFTYIARDSAGAASNTATVFLSIIPVNDPPIANPDGIYRAATNTPLTVQANVGVLQNDIDVDGPVLNAVAGVSTTANGGTVTLNADGSFVYNPAPGFNGIDTFTYQATDTLLTSNIATVTLSVSPNAAPIATNDSNPLYRTAPSVPLTITSVNSVLQNDLDEDGPPPLSAVAGVSTTASGGTVTLNADGSFIYTPVPGFTGPTDTFTYQATDGLAISNLATVTISVAPNNPPVAVNDNSPLYRTSPGIPLTVSVLNSVLNNDSDGGDGPFLQAVTAVTTTANGGTVTLNADGSFIYTPAAGFSGPTDTFTYQVTDGIDVSAPATVTLTVAPNTPPVAQNDTGYRAIANSPLTVGLVDGVLNNDSDGGDGPFLQAVAGVSTTASGGTVTLNADGSFIYNPAPGFTNANDTFTYQATDGIDLSNLATVTISVFTNTPPTAVNDSYSTTANRPLNVDAPGVLANDSDAENPITAILETLPGNGTITFRNDGSFDYLPNPGFTGTDFFTYRANDGFVNSGLATVSITVSANVAPVANPDNYSVNLNNVLSVPFAFGTTTVAGVLSNDVDNDPLTASLVTGPSRGNLLFNADGSFIYTPTVTVGGTDTFVYRASDGQLTSDATVTITIRDSSTPPTANGNTFSVSANNTLTVSVAESILNNDTDPDGDRLTARITAQPINGSVSLNPDGSFVYTPNANFANIDTFTYVANDGVSDSNPAIVTITVGAVNSPPVVSVPGGQATFRNTELIIPSLQISDPDAGNNPVRVTLTANNGSLTLSTTTGLTVIDADGDSNVEIEGSIVNINAALNNLRYRPNEEFTGTDAIQIVVDDLGNTSITGEPQTGSGVIVVNVDSGAFLLKDINQNINESETGTLSSSPTNLTAIGGNLYFAANDGFNGVELWKSDGTAAGTFLVADINPSPGGNSTPANFTSVGNTLFFTANNGTLGTELWKIDEVSGTPVLVRNIRPGAPGSNPGNLVNFNNTLFFRADDGTGLALWKSDGTFAGTVKVGTGFTQPGALTVVGNTLYFTTSNGNQLWKTDGTDAGTVQVRNLGAGGNATSLTAIGNTLFFTANNSGTNEVWRSDGTTAGTTPLSQLNPGLTITNPNNLVNFGSDLYFLARNGSTFGLYRSTAAGTVSLVQSLPSAGQPPANLTVVGSTLFFTVDVGSAGTPDIQLWKSNGTTAELVRDINPLGNANPASLTNVNGFLYFTANDGATRVWRSDGTEAGTTPVSGAFTGAVPSQLTAVGNRLYFTADTVATGTELWIV